ncbi:MAG: hypothetical protein CBB71_20160 [Rhodopirellula sp. TMED11]|nr:MAG: hypothetical protein CBB71_20160 [Rhodopirellula sp. TMED11]
MATKVIGKDSRALCRELQGKRSRFSSRTRDQSGRWTVCQRPRTGLQCLVFGSLEKIVKVSGKFSNVREFPQEAKMTHPAAGWYEPGNAWMKLRKAKKNAVFNADFQGFGNRPAEP